MDNIEKQRRLTKLQDVLDNIDDNIKYNEMNITITRVLIKKSAEEIISGIVDNDNVIKCKNDITKYTKIVLDLLEKIDVLNAEKIYTRKIIKEIINL